MATQGHLVLINTDDDYLISELSRIAHDINTAWMPSQTIKKYRSLNAQLHQITDGHALDSMEKFEILREFFFQQKKFAPLASKPKLEKYLLPYILLSRSGPREILILLFICLARSLQLQLDVIKHDSSLILKMVHEGRSYLFDFTSRCEPLDSERVLQLVNQGCDCTKNFEFNEVLTRYLLLIKTQCLRERSFITLYKIQSYLIHYQPFVLNHLVDRARAAYAIGDLVKAAEDIGQYLTFRTDKIANYKFLKLLKKLRSEELPHP